MLTLSTVMSLAAAGYAIAEGQSTPTIECVHERFALYSAPDWDSLEFYANNYQLCECPWHRWH